MQRENQQLKLNYSFSGAPKCILTNGNRIVAAGPGSKAKYLPPLWEQKWFIWILITCQKVCIREGAT